MTTSEPRITLSIKRSDDGTPTIGELNSLSLGFGIFQVWLFMAVYNASQMMSPSALLPSFPFLPQTLSIPVLVSFLLVGGLSLLALGATNQLFLRFYVSKRALAAATLLCCLGTALLYGGSVPHAGAAFALAGGSIMGLGSSLLFIIWGTTFARFQFATIVLNTSIAYVLGIAFAVVFANVVPAPISGLITLLLPLAAMLILMRLIPRPYYQRHEEPIFHPLSANKVSATSFLARFGVPVLIVGVTLGALRSVCIGEVFPSGSLTIQLMFALSCICSLIIFIIAIALTKRDLFWDTLFRVTMPITMAGIASIALLTGEFDVIGSLFVSMGYVCLEIMLWVFFAGIAQRFRISPIFVFGIGRGLLELGSVFGSVLIVQAFQVGMSEMHLTQAALILAVLLSVGYALLPRYREIQTMINQRFVTHEKPEAPVQMWDSAANSVSAPPSPANALTATGTIGVFGGRSLYVPITGTPPDANATPVQASSENATDAPQAPKVEPQEETEEEKGSFKRRCEELSGQYLLSAREKEVLLLLAKGHNASFIQEQLCVSKSTAKTHINHIYKKMDIHTQQELLNMVEDRPHPKHKNVKNAAAIKPDNPGNPANVATKPRTRSLRADIFATK